MSERTPIFDEWSARGLVHQATASGVERALDAERLTAYIGFDPTAASLHVGSLLQVVLLMRLERAGHRPIALVGGGTGMIGDPSGRDSERSMLDLDTLAANCAGLRAQLENFLDFSGPRGALMLDNSEWLCELNLIEFLRDVGKHFSVNSMIARESVKRRLETRDHGISFTEFAYSLLQAYDFLELYDRHGCTLQLGGSDQWGNIVAGTDLIRRQREVEAHGLTVPLITRADGKKFGKSERGNVWLDPELTSPYELYQFWLNSPDEDVIRLLHFFTFLTLEEIAELGREVAERPAERAAQRRLAAVVTEMVHGAEARQSAERTAQVLFAGGDLRELDAAEVRAAFAGSPTSDLGSDELAGGLPLVDALVRTSLSASKSRARHDVTSGAVTVNHVRETDPRRRLTVDDALAGRYIVLRRGKKTYGLLAVVAGG